MAVRVLNVQDNLMKENKFNLIDEPWIPIVNSGKVSLKQVFTEASYKTLGGNPIQKIAITKLLLAIAQAACTPEDAEDWEALEAEGLADECLNYLEKWHDRFYLYGEKPFLQMPAISVAKEQTIGAVLPEIATGNTTIFNAIQLEKILNDADKALLILTLMGFALSGKKTDNTVVLSVGYKGKTKPNGKPTTGKSGTSLGFMGFLHSFLLTETLQQTLWLNLFTQEQIKDLTIYPQGIGTPPWEAMPEGEDCPQAQQLKQSLMGRLIPVSRFCLLSDKGLHYSEGIAHLDYKSGIVDPSVAVNFDKKDAKIIWVDPERKPWRFLTALLGFMEANSGGFNCSYLSLNFLRARNQNITLGLWSGGLRVSSNAGEQYCSGSDDFVESTVLMPSDDLGETWYAQLKLEMAELDKLAKIVYSSTLNYFKSQNSEGKNQAALASNLFWQLAERQFQNLLDACGDIKKTNQLRKIYVLYINQAYEHYCPKETARQIDAWAKNRPNLSKYLKNTMQSKEAKT